MTEKTKEGVLFVGWNSKHYDKGIVQGICRGATPEQLKQINDWIIVDSGAWWECPVLNKQLNSPRMFYYDVDIKDDSAAGTSLKSVESEMGWKVRESTVDFTHTDKLTTEQMQEVIEYCEYDVETTARIIEMRKDYLLTKAYVGQLAGVKLERALASTNGTLVGAYLNADPLTPSDVREADEREYTYPVYDNFPLPQIAIDFFERRQDKSLSRAELFGADLKFEVGGCPTTLAFGGIHGAVKRSVWISDEENVVLNYDVASLYPSLIIVYDLMSRYTPDSSLYAKTRDIRIEAKNSGDKAKSNALKLVLNTTYGVMLQKFSHLYDPRQVRSVCITGQLTMLGLAMRCIQIEGLELIQLNTDGIMFKIPRNKHQEVKDLMSEWEKTTGLIMEEDVIDKIYQRDVNNYAALLSGGKEKLKGGALNRGLKVGSFGVNNNATIVPEALKNYFFNDIPVEETINSCNDIFKFQFTAKASHKYSHVYQLVDGEQIPQQRCNRVYASTNEKYGTLYKVSKSTGRPGKIPSLPEHCIIDNENELTIKDIDKSWYVKLAQKQLREFLPPRKGKKMAEKTTATKKTTTKKASKPTNVYAKLIKARHEMQQKAIDKTGKNRHLEYTYFTLDDIVPTATEIFDELGLILIVNDMDAPIISETTEKAEEITRIWSAQVVDIDDPTSTIDFRGTYIQNDQVLTKTGKAATTAIQAAGAAITYWRRYIWMIVLDLVETDLIDQNAQEPKDETQENSAKAPAKKKSMPLPKNERQQLAKEMTDGAEASELMLTTLKKNAVCRRKRMMRP